MHSHIATFGKLTPADLTRGEKSVFEDDFARLVDFQGLTRSLRNLLYSQYEDYVFAARVAKRILGQQAVFDGNNAVGNELGMQLIRAVTVRNPGILPGGTPQLSWSQTYSTAGWQDVFGSASNPVDLSQTGSAGSSATNTEHRVMVAFGAFVNASATPLLTEYRFHFGQTDYGAQPIAWQPATAFVYARLWRFVIIPPGGQFNMRGNISASGADGTQLLGLAFATADYLTLET